MNPNLPPGVSDRDIDRAAGVYDEDYEEIGDDGEIVKGESPEENWKEYEEGFL